MCDWMGKLPTAVRKKPLCRLCIPGSHDSGAYWFNMQMGYAHDQSFLRYIRHFKCDWVKRIVERWALTQALSMEEQLKHGVRFFDLRLELAVNADTASTLRHDLADLEDPSEKSCFIVHGLYSSDWLKLAYIFIGYLEKHPQEVIILNVNHIYQMTDFDFRRFFLHPLANIAGRAGILLCSTEEDLRTISLDELLEKRYRIIVVGPLDQDVDGCCFRSAWVQNRWPNKNNTVDIVNFIQAQIHAPVTPGLRVLQAVVTPKLFDIFKNWRTSLRNRFSLPLRGVLKQWLDNLDAEEIGNLNILISDQVDEEHCRSVIYLNVRDYPGHNLDGELEITHTDWKAIGSYPTPPMSEKRDTAMFLATVTTATGEDEPHIVIEELLEDLAVKLPPKKPIRTSVLIQQVEMVLETGTSASSTSSPAASPIPPPKPKRFSRRIPLVMEVEPILDDAIPIVYPEVPNVPLSRSSDTPVRIAAPVTAEELRMAALGEYERYVSMKKIEIKEEEINFVEGEEDEDSADESSPLVAHDVENMVEDLVINSTIDAMEKLAGQFDGSSN